MTVYLNVALCFLPLLAALAVVFAAPTGFRPREALAPVLLGLLAVVPITVVQLVVVRAGLFHTNSLAAILAESLLLNGLIEEGGKAAGLAALKNKTPGTFMLQGALLGLAAACFETVLYVVGGQGSVLLRSVTAGLVHTECAAIVSLGVRAWKNGGRPVAPFVTAVVVHGVYNFFAAFPAPLWWFSIAAIALGGVQCRVHYKKAVALDFAHD
jgi:RsiW-degrading membrane proteinase PrsW (M82 family)